MNELPVGPVPKLPAARPMTVRWATILLFACAGLSLINAVPLFMPAAYVGLPTEAVGPTAVLLALVSAGIVAVPVPVPVLVALAVLRGRRWPQVVLAAYAVLIAASALTGGAGPSLAFVGMVAAAIAATILLWMPASREFAVPAEVERAERGKVRRSIWRPVPALPIPAPVAWASGLVTLTGGLWTIPTIFMLLFSASQPGLSAGDWQVVLLTGAFAAAHFLVAVACWRGRTWAWVGLLVLLVVAGAVSIRVNPVALFDVALLLVAGLLLLTRDARAFIAGTGRTLPSRRSSSSMKARRMHERGGRSR